MDPQLGPSLAPCLSYQLKETRFRKAEQKLHSLLKGWRRESLCSKDTFSQKEERGGGFLKGKRQVHPQKLGKRAEISRHSHAWAVPQAPSNAELIVLSKIQVPLRAEVLAW